MPTITDWIMVEITTVYVVATILICFFNYKAAKATKEQTQEMKNQFYAVNRPIVTVEIAFIKKMFWAVRFVNHGTQTAFDTRVIFDDEFINSIPNELFKTKLIEEKDAVFTLGVNQCHDVFIGEKDYINLKHKKSALGQIIYKGVNNSVYAEDFQIQLDNYATFYSVNSDIEDVWHQLKSIDKKMGEMVRIFNKR